MKRKLNINQCGGARRRCAGWRGGQAAWGTQGNVAHRRRARNTARGSCLYHTELSIVSRVRRARRSPVGSPSMFASFQHTFPFPRPPGTSHRFLNRGGVGCGRIPRFQLSANPAFRDLFLLQIPGHSPAPFVQFLSFHPSSNIFIRLFLHFLCFYLKPQFKTCPIQPTLSRSWGTRIHNPT